MKFIESIFEKLKRHPKRIVFPEGTEPRVLRAAERFVELKLGAPILLGKRMEIEEAAKREGVNLHRIGMIDPATAADLQIFTNRLERLSHYRPLGSSNIKELILNPNFFGAMMIQNGQADGLVGGSNVNSGTLLRPLLRIVKPLPGVQSISSCMALELPDKKFGENGVLFFADCAVIPEPGVDQLAQIALLAGKACALLTGIRPRVALLSYSTKGSSSHPSTERVVAATALARQKIDKQDVFMEIDGELQADAAIVEKIGLKKAPGSTVAGKANVLVFPDLNSGNIAAKLVQHLAGAEVYGQLLLGLSKPAADMSRSATVEQILGMAAIVGLQAIEYRKLYPVDENADF